MIVQVAAKLTDDKIIVRLGLKNESLQWQNFHISQAF